MSDKTFTQSRRNFLKSAAYTSALSVGSLSGVAMAAKSSLSTEAKSSADEATGSSKSENRETVILFNQSGETVQLDAENPVSLELLNGWAVVKINKQLDSNLPSISLAPGQRQGFSVDSVLGPLLDTTGNYIVITSEFTALNNVVPISSVDVAVA